MKNRTRIKALSLFANVGIAETYLSEIGIDVVVANEVDSRRVKLYKHLYPSVEMIEGDITTPQIKQEIIKTAKQKGVNMIIATPPCQGMSTAGKMDEWDSRNALISHAVELIKALQPDFVFLENVPQQLTTKISYKGKIIFIPQYVREELEDSYLFNDDYVIEAADYGVPQFRERAIMLLVKRTIGKKWVFPKKTKRVTLEEAIGALPSVDPEIYDIPHDQLLKVFPNFEKKKAEALSISPWHYPPKHIYRQVVSMMHTPTGMSAFDNKPEYQPRKKDGTLVTGFKNTYKRQLWNQPGFTVTMYSREISSQNNVHPGRFIGTDVHGNVLYSDARVMTIFELMIMSSLPKNWNIPIGTSDHFIRCVIGEGIPPLLVKKIMQSLLEVLYE